MQSMLSGNVFDIDILDQRPGQIIFIAKGKGAAEAFQHEAGGHRWQRVSATEKRGRYHTSTITVVVLKEFDQNLFIIDPKDLRWKFARGSGKGGQRKNKKDTCVQLTHIPTGISVKVDGRSRTNNEEDALNILQHRLQNLKQQEDRLKRDNERKNQHGSGQRGDKIRTISVRNDQVINHSNDKRITYKIYLSGELESLF